MIARLSKAISAAGMAAALAVGSIPKPAAADSQSTINTIIGAAAVIGGIILYNNYQHKRQAANSIVGYTRNGGTVYGDGRIVMPNGQTVYPNSNGQYPWGQTAYYNPNSSGYTYDPQRTGRWDSTHRHGTYWANNRSYAPVARPVYAHPVYARPVYAHPAPPAQWRGNGNSAYAHARNAERREERREIRRADKREDRHENRHGDHGDHHHR